MKTLIVVRHAKSSWSTIGEKDFDRPLNERGKEDAPVMAEKLVKTNIKVDAFISSSAKRARKTAKAFVEAYGKTKDDIILCDDLYNAPATTFYKTIEGLQDYFKTVAMFAHNPGITDFVNTLGDTNIDEMPTCAMFAVQASVTKWKDFKKGEKKLLFFTYPKDSKS